MNAPSIQFLGAAESVTGSRYLAETDDESWTWRSDFIASYVERDIPLMGPQVPATRMKKFWSMLAHYHGRQVSLSDLGRSLEVSHPTVR